MESAEKIRSAGEAGSSSGSTAPDSKNQPAVKGKLAKSKKATGKSKSTEDQSEDRDVEELDEYQYDAGWEEDLDEDKPRVSRWQPLRGGIRGGTRGRGYNNWVPRGNITRGRGGLVSRRFNQYPGGSRRFSMNDDTPDDDDELPSPRKLTNLQVKLQNGRRFAKPDGRPLVISDRQNVYTSANRRDREMTPPGRFKRMRVNEDRFDSGRDDDDWRGEPGQDYHQDRKNRFVEEPDIDRRPSRRLGLNRTDDSVDCRELLISKKLQRASDGGGDLREKIKRRGSRERPPVVDGDTRRQSDREERNYRRTEETSFRHSERFEESAPDRRTSHPAGRRDQLRSPGRRSGRELEKPEDWAEEMDRARDRGRERARDREMEREREERERLRAIEREREIERREIERREIEKQRMIEMDKQRMIEMEKQRMIEMEKQRMIEMEKQREIERQRLIERREIEKQREIEREREERQRKLERERELERKKEMERERERLEREREREQERLRELERQREAERQREVERQRELERQREVERQRELERQELERKREAEKRELERQRDLERKKREMEREREAKMKRERKMAKEREMERDRERGRGRERERERDLESRRGADEMGRLRDIEREKEREREREREKRAREKEREKGRILIEERNSFRERDRERIKDRELDRDRSGRRERPADDEWRDRRQPPKDMKPSIPARAEHSDRSPRRSFTRNKPEEDWHRNRYSEPESHDRRREFGAPPADQPWKNGKQIVKDWSSSSNPADPRFSSIAMTTAAGKGLPINPIVTGSGGDQHKGPGKWAPDAGPSSLETGFWHRRSTVEHRDFKDRAPEPFGARDIPNQSNDEPNEVIFILGLAPDVTELEIRQNIRDCDLWPSDVQLLVDSGGKSQGIMVVTFNSKDEAYSWMSFRKGKLALRNGNYAPMIYKSASYDWMCVRCNVPNYKNNSTCCCCKRIREECLDGFEEASPYPTNALLLRNVNPKTAPATVINTLKCYMMNLRLERLQIGPRCLCFLELTSVVDALALYTRLLGNALMIDKRQVVVSYARLECLPQMADIRNEPKPAPAPALAPSPFMNSYGNAMYGGPQRSALPMANPANPLQGKPIIERPPLLKRPQRVDFGICDDNYRLAIASRQNMQF